MSWELPEEKEKDAASRLTIGEVTATGGLTREAVRRSVEQQLRALSGCFPTSQAKAKITLKVVIDANGKVKSVTASSQEIKDKAMLKCLQRMAKSWTFGANSPGKETEATVSLQIG